MSFSILRAKNSEDMFYTPKYLVGFADYLLFWFSPLLFWLSLFHLSQILHSGFFFTVYTFKFMPAKLRRIGIDRNNVILSIA